MKQYIITFQNTTYTKTFDTLHEALDWARKYTGKKTPDMLYYGTKESKEYVGTFGPIEDDEDEEDPADEYMECMKESLDFTGQWW